MKEYRSIWNVSMDGSLGMELLCNYVLHATEEDYQPSATKEWPKLQPVELEKASLFVTIQTSTGVVPSTRDLTSLNTQMGPPFSI